MSHTIRTFIAFPLSIELQKIIKHVQNHLKQLDCHIKWGNPENIHLTIKFLGDVKLKNIEALTNLMSNLFKDTKSIKTDLTQLGAFPNSNRPRIVWIGLKDATQEIARLAKTIDKELGSIGFKKDPKPFTPHITIGRLRSPRNVIHLSQAISEFHLPENHTEHLNRIVLFKSTLTPQGPIHESLLEINLR